MPRIETFILLDYWSRQRGGISNSLCLRQIAARIDTLLAFRTLYLFSFRGQHMGATAFLASQEFLSLMSAMH